MRLHPRAQAEQPEAAGELQRGGKNAGGQRALKTTGKRPVVRLLKTVARRVYDVILKRRFLFSLGYRSKT